MANADESDAAASAEYDHIVGTEHDILSASDEYESPTSLDLSIKCYAILEFPDSYFYLHENSIVIGRNTEAERLHKLKQERSMREWNSGALEDEADGNQAFLEDEDWRERVSDPGNGHITVEGGTGGPQSSRHHSLELDQDEEFIAVHPPANENDSSVFHFRGISKKHLRVKLDDEFSWMLEILGRNGAYVNERYHSQGERVFLDDKDIITISSLPIRFHISDVDIDEEGDESTQTSSVEEEEQDAEAVLDGANEDEEEEVLMNRNIVAHEDADSDGDDDEGERSVAKPKPPKTKIKLNFKDPRATKEKSTIRRAKDGKPILGKSKKEAESSAGQMEDQPKRRGPGRPPADGVMSKRERREREKAAKAGVEYGDPIPVKPKSRSKAPSGEDEEEGLESGEKVVKNRKRKRSETENPTDTKDVSDQPEGMSEEPPPPPRSPTPREEDFTEEQLGKPDKTYHALLHEILQESKEPLALPQIYKIIRKKWPFFQFRVNGTGWESSVRHNLGNNKHFKTAGKAGKGYFWTIDSDVPFEPKAKRTSEPSRVVPYYPTAANSPMPQQAFKPIPPHSLPINSLGSSQYQSNQPAQYGQTSLQMNGQGTSGAAPPNISQPFTHYSQHPPNYTNSQPFPHHQNHFNAPSSINNTANPPVPNGQHISTSTSGMSRTPPLNGFRPPHPPPSVSGPSAPQNSVPTQAGRPPSYAVPPTPVGSSTVQQKSSYPPPLTNPSPGLERHMAQRRLTAFEQLDRGETPRVFQRFRDTLSKSAADPKEAEHLRTTAQSAIDWIVARPHADAKEDEKAHPSIKAIVKILRDLLVEDYKTSGAKIQRAKSPSHPHPNPNPNSNPAASNLNNPNTATNGNAQASAPKSQPNLADTAHASAPSLAANSPANPIRPANQNLNPIQPVSRDANPAMPIASPAQEGKGVQVASTLPKQTSSSQDILPATEHQQADRLDTKGTTEAK